MGREYQKGIAIGYNAVRSDSNDLACFQRSGDTDLARLSR